MRKVIVSGALAVMSLAATALPALVPTTTNAAAAAATGSGSGTTSTATRAALPGLSSGSIRPGIYHPPIIGKVTLPGLGSLLGGVRHAAKVQSSNWAGYADTNDTYNAVSASWTQPAVTCTNSRGGAGNLLGGLFGSPKAASSFWVGLDGYSTPSVEQIGADSDCSGKTPVYYAWYEMYPNPSVTLPSQYPVSPGDQMSALVASNAGGTSFNLMLKDATKGWSYLTTQTGQGFSRASAEVIAEAPSSCNVLFCSEVPLADFGQVPYSGSSLIDSAGRQGSLSAFNANEITMASGGTVLATPSNLSPDGSAFSVTWNNS